MLKKNLSIILLILFGLLLIAFVIWFFERRLNKIQTEMNQSTLTVKK